MTLPEKQLARALLASLETLEYALRLDRDAELLEEPELRLIDKSERKATAHTLEELHKLERRWPADCRAPRETHHVRKRSTSRLTSNGRDVRAMAFYRAEPDMMDPAPVIFCVTLLGLPL